MSRTVIAVIGHSPLKLLGGDDHFSFENKMLTYVFRLDLEKKLKQYNEVVCITGMALGVDMLYAIACLELKGAYKDRLKLICAIPFEGWSTSWSAEHKTMYDMIVASADAVVNTTGESNPPIHEVERLIQSRNEWMVNNTKELWALFDGSRGATKRCVDFALKNNIETRYYTTGLIRKR